MILALLPAALAGPLETTATVHVLDNGLTVVLEEDHRTDTVALHLRYGVGARDEQPGEYGCAHLFEHLMFEGSANVPENAFDDWLTAAGGNNNAWTSEDTTAYHMTFPSGASDLALFLESDRMAYLLAGVTADNVANQRLVVLQERAEGFAQPNGRDWDALVRLLWPEQHPYHHPVIGTVADVEGFEVEGVHGFWRRHYRPRNAVLALVGNFEADEMQARVERWFAEVPDPGPPEGRAEEAALEDRRADGWIEDDVEARTLYLAWPTVGEKHDDAAALQVMSYVLSGGRGTRLDDRLYYRSRLTLDAGAYSYPSQIGGMFLVYATVPKAPLTKAAAVSEDVIGSILAEPPTAAEMERAKKAMRGDFLDELERPQDRAEMLAWCQATWGTPDCLKREWDAVERVTADDVVRVAREYLVPERRVTLSVVPKGQGGALPGAVPVETP